MPDNYSLDTKNFTIDSFLILLKNKTLLPGRKLLKENIESNFLTLKKKGICSLFDLLETLKSKPKIERFATDSGLSVDYLILLRREANSYISTPIKLSDISYFDKAIINTLKTIGIVDSKQLLESTAIKSERLNISKKHGIDFDILTELVQICDLLRITGVGPVFAKIIFDSNIKSVNEFLSLDIDILYQQLSNTNDENKLTKAKFTRKDIEYCVELGQYLPLLVEK